MNDKPFEFPDSPDFPDFPDLSRAEPKPRNPTMHTSPNLAFANPKEISYMQQHLLDRHLDHCRAHSPFYRTKLPQNNDLATLPFTDKNDIALHNEDFIAASPQFPQFPQNSQNSQNSHSSHPLPAADISFTSGTTGKPCKIVYTRPDLERLGYNDASGFHAAGLQAGWKVLLTCTIDRCFIAGLAYFMGVQKLGATAIRNGINTVESHAEIIASQRPEAIVGVPSFLVRLLAHLRLRKIDYHCIKKLVCIGEPLRNREMEFTTIGKKLEAFLPGAAHSTYASSEIATSFTECEARCGGHCPPDLAIVEIVDENGHPVPDGEIGEVVVTPLQVTGTPLVRFRTGDISFIVGRQCACGRNTPRLGPIIGRKAHMLKIKGTLLFPSAIHSILDDLPEVSEYFLSASGDELSETLEISVAGHPTKDRVVGCRSSVVGSTFDFRQPTTDTPDSLDVKHIEELIYSRTRVRLPVREVSHAEAQQLIYGASRKPVRFFDHRGAQASSL